MALKTLPAVPSRDCPQCGAPMRGYWAFRVLPCHDCHACGIVVTHRGTVADIIAERTS